MKKSITMLAACAALTVSSLSLCAQVTPANPDKTYDIKAKFTVGGLLKYSFQMTMDMQMAAQNGTSPFPGGKMEMTSDLRYKTVGIKPDGTAVVVVQTENMKGTMAGNELPLPEAPPITMEIDAHGMGKVRGMENVPGGQAISQLMNMNRMPTMGVLLPDHPVKVGDSWSTEMAMPMGKAKIDCTLLGPETIGNAETLRIRMVTTIPIELKMGASGPVTDDAQAMMVMKGSAVGDNVLNILADSARIVKMAGDMTSKVKMEMKGEAAAQSPFGSELNMKMDGKITMKLVSVGKVPDAPAKAVASKPAAASRKP